MADESQRAWNNWQHNHVLNSFLRLKPTKAPNLRITGLLSRESYIHWWIPRTRGQRYRKLFHVITQSRQGTNNTTMQITEYRWSKSTVYIWHSKLKVLVFVFRNGSIASDFIFFVWWYATNDTSPADNPPCSTPVQAGRPTAAMTIDCVWNTSKAPTDQPT